MNNFTLCQLRKVKLDKNHILSLGGKIAFKIKLKMKFYHVQRSILKVTNA